MKKLLLTTVLMATAASALMAETVTFNFAADNPYDWNSLPKDASGYIDDSAKPLTVKEGEVSLTLDGSVFRRLVQKAFGGETCLLLYPQNKNNAVATTLSLSVPQGYKMTDITFYSGKGKLDGLNVIEGDTELGAAEETGEIYNHAETGVALAQISRMAYCNTAGPIVLEASGGTQVVERVEVSYEATTLKEAKLAWSASEFTAFMQSDNKFPTLSKATDAPVDYQSENEEVATIDASTGAITLLAPGITRIIAGCDANSTYDWGEASYTLIVRRHGEKVGTFDFSALNNYKGIIHVSPDEDNGSVIWTGLVADDAKAVYAGADGISLEDNGARIHFYAGPQQGIDKYTCRMRMVTSSSNTNLQITGGTAFEITAGGAEIYSIDVRFNPQKAEDVKAGNIVALNGDFPVEECDPVVVWTPGDGDKTKAVFQAIVGAYITNIDVYYAGAAGAVDAIAAPAGTDAPVEYFDLQGRRIASPATGVYIRRQGADVTKVYMK